MVRKVAIYSRVSTLDQTIDNQLLELRDHCSKMGSEIVKEYSDEGLSGALSREKRPALNSLIKDAYRKMFDGCVSIFREQIHHLLFPNISVKTSL